MIFFFKKYIILEGQFDKMIARNVVFVDQSNERRMHDIDKNM